MNAVQLRNDQIAALLGAAGLVDRLADDYPDADIDREILRSAAMKLQDAYLEGLCVHCRERARTRRNGLCDRCDRYARKYEGRLPSAETLKRTRARRRVMA